MTPTTTTSTTTNNQRTFKYLNPSLILNPKFDIAGIKEEDEEGFSKSIKENGVYDPIIVSVSNRDPNKYQIITGARRLHYAKRHKLAEIPCIIWKNANNTDIALAELVQIAHRRTYTDTQKAKAIAAVYETIGVPLQKAIQFVKQMHNEDYKKSLSLANSQTFKSDTNKLAKQIKPTPEFLKLFEKIGYSGSTQYQYLQLITQIEPEVLEHAESRGLSMPHKALLTHSALKKSLDESNEKEERKTMMKKHLINQIAGKPLSEARNIVHKTISDVRENRMMQDLDSELREQFKDDIKLQNMVKEGKQSATLAFMAINEGIDNAIKAFTNGHLKIERGEAGWDEIPSERIQKVIKAHSIEIIKNMKDLELYSVLEKIKLCKRFANEIIPILEEEEENRIKKSKMLST